MDRFVKIGADMINLDAVSRVTVIENQSGISDRILIQVGESEVVVDSAIGGRKRMEAIRERLTQVLSPEDWDNVDPAVKPTALPPLSVRAA